MSMAGAHLKAPVRMQSAEKTSRPSTDFGLKAFPLLRYEYPNDARPLPVLEVLPLTTFLFSIYLTLPEP